MIKFDQQRSRLERLKELIDSTNDKFVLLADALLRELEDYLASYNDEVPPSCDGCGVIMTEMQDPPGTHWWVCSRFDRFPSIRCPKCSTQFAEETRPNWWTCRVCQWQ